MMKMKLMQILMALCTLYPTATLAETKKKKEGSTTVRGTVTTSVSGDMRKIDIKTRVTKSGVSGTGKGVTSIQLFNSDFEPRTPIQVKKTVGADAIRGTRTKSNSKSISIPADRFEGYIWAVGVAESIGFPRSIGDLRRFLRDEFGVSTNPVELLKSLSPGGSRDLGAGITMVRFRDFPDGSRVQPFADDFAGLDTLDPDARRGKADFGISEIESGRESPRSQREVRIVRISRCDTRIQLPNVSRGSDEDAMPGWYFWLCWEDGDSNWYGPYSSSGRADREFRSYQPGINNEIDSFSPPSYYADRPEDLTCDP